MAILVHLSDHGTTQDFKMTGALYRFENSIREMTVWSSQFLVSMCYVCSGFAVRQINSLVDIR